MLISYVSIHKTIMVKFITKQPSSALMLCQLQCSHNVMPCHGADTGRMCSNTLEWVFTVNGTPLISLLGAFTRLHRYTKWTGVLDYNNVCVYFTSQYACFVTGTRSRLSVHGQFDEYLNIKTKSITSPVLHTMNILLNQPVRITLPQ